MLWLICVLYTFWFIGFSCLTDKEEEKCDTDTYCMKMSQYCNLFFSGLTFKETWTTDNVISTEIKIKDQIAKGHFLTFDTSFAPQTS